LSAAHNGAGGQTKRQLGPVGRVVGSGALLAGAVRAAARVVPGAGLVLGAVANARAAERLAARATVYYRALASTRTG
jgi:hypothetical protein